MRQRLQPVSGRRLQERRKHYFAEHPLCKRCEDKGLVVAAQELDHIVPLHKGGSDDPSNWQGLCTPCHKDKTREDCGHRPRLGCDENGTPLDPNHHWFRR